MDTHKLKRIWTIFMGDEEGFQDFLNPENMVDAFVSGYCLEGMEAWAVRKRKAATTPEVREHYHNIVLLLENCRIEMLKKLRNYVTRKDSISSITPF